VAIKQGYALRAGPKERDEAEVVIDSEVETDGDYGTKNYR
jgi:hypothetical protein